MMLLVNTYLDTSVIEGIGVFAAEFIKKGTLIWTFNPLVDIVLSPEQLQELAQPCREFIEKVAIPFPFDADNYCLALDHSNYINHSDTPNMFGDDQDFAVRDIPKGTELTVNYYNEGYKNLPWKSTLENRQYCLQEKSRRSGKS